MAAPHKSKLTVVEFGSNRHKAMNVDPDWVKAKHYENNDQTPLTDMDPPLLGTAWMEPKFQLQLSGSGAAGTAPPIGVLLKDCLGMTELVTPTTSVSYTAGGSLIAAGASMTQFYGNGLRQLSSSTVGTGKFTMKPGEPCIFDFEGSGLFDAVTEAAGSAALPTQANPVVCKGIASLIGANPQHIKELIFDVNNEHNGPWEDLSATAGVIQGCRPPLLINQTPLAEALIVVPALASINAWVDMLANASHAFSAVLGSVAGNIVNIDRHRLPARKA